MSQGQLHWVSHVVWHIWDLVQSTSHIFCSKGLVRLFLHHLYVCGDDTSHGHLVPRLFVLLYDDMIYDGGSSISFYLSQYGD